MGQDSSKFLEFFGAKNIMFFSMFLLVLLIGCAKGFDKKSVEIGIGNGKNMIKVRAEIADDNGERMKGLMFRERLDKNAGMLFVFDDENYQTFWMKNTLIPLDIVFIGKDLEIVDIKNAAPCREEPCELYKSSAPAKFVLEVNSNFTTKNKIKIGDMVTLG